MSNSHLFLTAGFPRAPLQNGLGRYICQLQRVTLKFCKSHGSSRGMREFLELDLVDFAKNHPETVVYVKPRRHKSPHIVAEYLNGDRQLIFCKDYTREEINKWLNLLRTQSGDKRTIQLRKFWHTDCPSIQGVWTPFTNRDPVINREKLVDLAAFTAPTVEKTATEILLEKYEQLKLDGQVDSNVTGEEKTQN